MALPEISAVEAITDVARAAQGGRATQPDFADWLGEQINSTDGKIKWAHATDRLNIDDLLLTSDRAYCVGHNEKDQNQD